jgi:phenylalanyl-tRNA synthetase beta chain
LDETKETKTRDEEWLVAATTHPTASFSEIKSALDAFFMNLGVNWQIKATLHPSFIEGRVGAVMVNGVNVGVLGEVHPQVLESWKLENPVAAFEINMQKIIKSKSMKWPESRNMGKSEEVQDEALKKEKEKKKARHRKRGPYRKAHANW